MKQLLIFFLISITTLNCNNKKSEKKKGSDFENYILSINQIPIPLNYNSKGSLPNVSPNFDKKGFDKFKHKRTNQPLGILYNDGKTIGLIDCSLIDWGLAPYLTTYDLMGNKIDSIGLFKKSAFDMGYQAMEYITLNNRSITITDTIKEWKINTEGSDIIKGSMEMTTGKVEYQILENGKIKKSESQVKKEITKEKSKSQIISECANPDFFDFKNYREYCINDTISIDLNGNGIIEKIYFDKKDCPKLIIEEKGKDLISIGCRNEKHKGFPNAIGWVNLWCVVSDKETYEVIVENGELMGSKTVNIERPSIYVGKEEAGGGIITYRNGKLYWIHQSD